MSSLSGTVNCLRPTMSSLLLLHLQRLAQDSRLTYKTNCSGSFLSARSMISNSSFKPTPLRGAA